MEEELDDKTYNLSPQIKFYAIQVLGKAKRNKGYAQSRMVLR